MVLKLAAVTHSDGVFQFRKRRRPLRCVPEREEDFQSGFVRQQLEGVSNAFVGCLTRR
uniref:hypothetical protein n=1 Tax=Haladaptatus cibarius TaxID=453847 RepID=UPI000B2C1A22|nr:hypothetical protein [Haladaptatus cibarius]